MIYVTEITSVIQKKKCNNIQQAMSYGFTICSFWNLY